MSRFELNRTIPAVTAALALGLGGCATNADRLNSGPFCEGTQPYLVQPGDTLTEVIAKKVDIRGTLAEKPGYTSRIAVAMGGRGLDNADSSAFPVYRYEDGVPVPGLTAGAEISLPDFCSDPATERTLAQANKA